MRSVVTGQSCPAIDLLITQQRRYRTIRFGANCSEAASVGGYASRPVSQLTSRMSARSTLRSALRRSIKQHVTPSDGRQPHRCVQCYCTARSCERSAACCTLLAQPHHCIHNTHSQLHGRQPASTCQHISARSRPPNSQPQG